MISLQLPLATRTEWEDRRLRVFEKRVFRRIFGPRRDEVTGEWSKLHNEELNEFEKNEMGGARSAYGGRG